MSEVPKPDGSSQGTELATLHLPGSPVGFERQGAHGTNGDRLYLPVNEQPAEGGLILPDGVELNLDNTAGTEETDNYDFDVLDDFDRETYRELMDVENLIDLKERVDRAVAKRTAELTHSVDSTSGSRISAEEVTAIKAGLIREYAKIGYGEELDGFTEVQEQSIASFIEQPMDQIEQYLDEWLDERSKPNIARSINSEGLLSVKGKIAKDLADLKAGTYEVPDHLKDVLTSKAKKRQHIVEARISEYARTDDADTFELIASFIAESDEDIDSYVSAWHQKYGEGNPKIKPEFIKKLKKKEAKAAEAEPEAEPEEAEDPELEPAIEYKRTKKIRASEGLVELQQDIIHAIERADDEESYDIDKRLDKDPEAVERRVRARARTVERMVDNYVEAHNLSKRRARRLRRSVYRHLTREDLEERHAALVDKQRAKDEKAEERAARRQQRRESRKSARSERSNVVDLDAERKKRRSKPKNKKSAKAPKPRAISRDDALESFRTDRKNKFPSKLTRESAVTSFLSDREKKFGGPESKKKKKKKNKGKSGKGKKAA